MKSSALKGKKKKHHTGLWSARGRNKLEVYEEVRLGDESEFHFHVYFGENRFVQGLGQRVVLIHLKTFDEREKTSQSETPVII